MTSPSYPLSPEAFRRALRFGHGRAWIHVAEFGADGLREDISEAALVSLAFDAQTEGNRGSWLADLCEAAEIVDAVIAAPIPTETTDFWQRCDLLRELAGRGHMAARELLYTAAESTEGELRDSACESLVALDGADGLEFLARSTGRRLRGEPNRFVSDGPARWFDDAHGEGAALRLLEPLATADADVAAYLAAVQRPCVASPRRPDSRPSVDAVIEAIREANCDLYWPVAWALRATAAEMERIAQLTTPDTPVRVLVNGLRCAAAARVTELESPPSTWFELVHHRDAEVREWCQRALGRRRDVRVREIGVELLSTDLVAALTLLTRNADPADADAIAASLRPIEDDGEQHSAVSDLIEVLELTQVGDPRLAAYVYEHSHCTTCRRRALGHLLEWNACPDWIAEEASHDAEPDIRAMAVAHTRGPQA